MTPSRTISFEGQVGVEAATGRRGFVDPSAGAGAGKEVLEGRYLELRRQLEACEWRSPEILVRAAGLAGETGRRREALDMLSRALEMDPGDAYARAQLRALATPQEMSGLHIQPDPVSLTRNPLEPILYPFRGNGPYMFVLGGLFFGLIFAGASLAASVAFIFAIPVLCVALIMIGYLAKYMERVVCNSALGKAEAPDWPDFNPGNVTMPIKIGFLYLVSQLPALVFAILAANGLEIGGLAGTIISFVLTEIGFIFFPMMLLIFFIQKSTFAALNPFRLFGGISAGGGQYMMAVLIWLVVLPVRAALMGALGSVPVVGIVLSTPVSLYFYMVGCRAIGLVYQSRQKQMGWY
jgi:hypothetical protein